MGAVAKTVKPVYISKALVGCLEEYLGETQDAVNEAGEKAMKKLVKLTKTTAPKDSGFFASHISSEEKTTSLGDKVFTWGVKAPAHRVTHLIVHGHAKADGGRVPGNPFLENAMEAVLPEYERAVEEAVKND